MYVRIYVIFPGYHRLRVCFASNRATEIERKNKKASPSCGANSGLFWCLKKVVKVVTMKETLLLTLLETTRAIKAEESNIGVKQW